MCSSDLIRLQGRIGHGVATVFDDQGFAMKFADVGQGLGQDLGFVARINAGGGLSHDAVDGFHGILHQLQPPETSHSPSCPASAAFTPQSTPRFRDFVSHRI